jgi:large subunit ribosomal protein L15
MNIQISRSVKRSKRVGRGPGSGVGKTSGRGMNGQRSRAGSSTTFFEGGQTKLINRLPKARGFKSVNKKTISVTSDFVVKNFKTGEEVTSELIAGKLKLSRNQKNFISGIKIINSGSSLKNLKIAPDLKVSKSLR